MDESEVVRRCQNGDQEAFRLIVERYSGVLGGTAYLMTRDRAQVDDLLQETFLLAWRGIGTLRASGNLKAWLVRILVNKVISERRKKRVMEAELVEVESKAGDSNSEELVLADEERQRIRGALETLPEAQRQVTVLRYFADLTIPEVARVLGCREGTVKSRLHRALAQLRTVLQSETVQASL
ncbi:MAG: sigma-70 family RNA polymerase sigma factor [SAR202 cluster bacterium]|nr:sigma-70 family RNA polymerase sigma factor [SAR202 cluster bacterium]